MQNRTEIPYVEMVSYAKFENMDCPTIDKLKSHEKFIKDFHNFKRQAEFFDHSLLTATATKEEVHKSKMKMYQNFRKHIESLINKEYEPIAQKYDRKIAFLKLKKRACYYKIQQKIYAKHRKKLDAFKW